MYFDLIDNLRIDIKMARIFIEYLGCDKVYNCKKCWSPLVAQEQLVSKVSRRTCHTQCLYERQNPTHNHSTSHYNSHQLSDSDLTWLCQTILSIPICTDCPMWFFAYFIAQHSYHHFLYLKNILLFISGVPCAYYLVRKSTVFE